MRLDGVFQLLRRHVLAASGDDDVLLAVHDAQKAFLRHADVAGVKPALGIKRLGRRLWIAVVGRKNRRTAQEDLAVIGQLEVDDVDGGTDGAETKMVPAIDEGRGGGLGQPVAFQNEQSGAVEKLGDLAGKRRPT